jgi:hypothetical protein
MRQLLQLLPKLKEQKQRHLFDEWDQDLWHRAQQNELSYLELLQYLAKIHEARGQRRCLLWRAC